MIPAGSRDPWVWTLGVSHAWGGDSGGTRSEGVSKTQPFWLKHLVASPDVVNLLFVPRTCVTFIRTMSFPAEVLINQIVGGDDAAVLVGLCRQHGLHQAVQIGMLDDGDATEFLGPKYPHLSGTLGKVRQRARGLVKGWAVNTTSQGMFGVGTGGGPVLCQPPQPADPGLVQAPVSMCLPAAWARLGVERAVRHQARCEPPAS